MLSEQILQDLIAFKPGAPVLSVYLNTDPTQRTTEESKLILRQLIKPFEDEAPEDVEAILRFVEHRFDWSGRGLALFSSVPADFFRHIPLGLPVRSRARLLNRPYVKPLAALLENFGHYGMALIDQQNLRLFRFHLGELAEEQKHSGEPVRHMKRGGGSQAAGRRGGVAGLTRSAEETVERNLREAARQASRFFERQAVRRVLIGGTEENTQRFIEELPKRWQSLIVGTFPIEMNAGHAQVLEKALATAQAAERKKESRLVQALITAAAKGQEGVVGLDDTLEAVHAGKVQTLVLSDGYRAPGYRCMHCGFLTAQDLETCPFCGNPIEQIPDAVELAVRRVLSDGGEVEIIPANPQLETAGRIGALLRY